jgi:hypothetical protein
MVFSPVSPAPAASNELALGLLHTPSEGGSRMARDITMLDLVNAVAEHSRSDDELIATVVYLINSGTVRLCGTFADASFDLRGPRRGPRPARV